MAKITELIQEIHRRSLWQVLGVYGLTAWVVWQVVVSLYEGIGLPDWVPAVALVLILVGLPIVLATAFVQEGGPTLGGDGARVEGFETTPEAVAADRSSADPTPDGPAQPADPSEPAGRASGGPAGRGSGSRSFLTWSRAITGGVLAFAALGLAATGFMASRALGIGPAATLISSGELDAAAPVVLAQFDNTTDDDELGRVVTDMLRVDLHASSVIRLVEQVDIDRALKLMRRPDVNTLDSDVALEIAARQGYGGVIGGEVARVGGSYLLTAEVVAPDGRTLAAFRETAGDDAELLEAVDRLSASIRGKVGESLKSVRSGPTLAQVTTGSLEALRLYSEALTYVERGDPLRAYELLEEAIRLDPEFAMAHRKIAVIWSNGGLNRDRMVEAAVEAYEHRDRLTDLERLYAEANYHEVVAGDFQASAAAYETALARYPTANTAINNLAFLRNRQGEHARAEALVAPARERGNLWFNGYFNLAYALWGQDRIDEAEDVLTEMWEVFPQSPDAIGALGQIAAVESELEESDSIFRSVAERFPNNLVYQFVTERGLARNAGRRGRVRETLTHLNAVIDAAERLGVLRLLAPDVFAEAALLAARTLGPDAFRGRLQELERRAPLDSLPPLNRPYHRLAQAYLWLDRPGEAERLLDDLEASVPAEKRGALADTHEILRAWVRTQRGDTAALSVMRRALDRHICKVCLADVVGYAHERAGRDGEAIEIYRQLFDRQDVLARWETDPRAVPFVHERLASLYERTGQRAEAARHYREFADLWSDADPELQPRVAAARRGLQRLAREGN